MMFTLSLLFFIGILLIYVGAQRPDIVDEILPEVKQKTQTGYLNCTVVNKGSESVVQWSKVETVNGGNPILLSEDDKIVYQGNTVINEESGLRKYDMESRINGRRVTYMLVIRYLTEEDGGDYLCTIRIQGVQWPEWPKKIGKLTVQTAPQIQPNINSIYEKEIGSSLQLTCESHGNPYPNISWKREDGQELPTGGFQSRGATLNLTDIQRNDRGNYICVADNNVKPPDSFKVEVIVFFQPSCRPVQSAVGQAKNRRFNAKLDCIVAGYPQPSMKWIKQSENGTLTEIEDDDKYDITKQFSSQLQNDEFWYTLLVKNVQATDYTNYYCVGTNKYGEGKTTIVLFETMECQRFNCPYLDEILPEMKQKGETGYLNCTVLKNRYCNVVKWSKARVNETGNPILISENETIIDQEMLSSEKVGLGKYDVQTLTNENKTSYILVIRIISEVDAGEYYCSLTPEGQTSYICDQKTGILYVNETLYCQGTDCPSSSGPQMEHFMAFLTLFLLCLKHCIT